MKRRMKKLKNERTNGKNKCKNSMFRNNVQNPQFWKNMIFSCSKNAQTPQFICMFVVVPMCV